MIVLTSCKTIKFEYRLLDIKCIYSSAHHSVPMHYIVFFHLHYLTKQWISFHSFPLKDNVSLWQELLSYSFTVKRRLKQVFHNWFTLPNRCSIIVTFSPSYQHYILHVYVMVEKLTNYHRISSKQLYSLHKSCHTCRKGRVVQDV